MEKKGHKLIVDLPSSPIQLEADPTRLEQILDNLLTNAAKYCDPGGRIVLCVRREGNVIVICLRDNGIGIDSEKLPHIFDLFVQAERRLDRSQGGLGLGLSLVKSLVEMHGGTVSATSPGLGQGSEFTVRLPVIPEVASKTALSNGELSRRRDEILPIRRILVVDDNVDSARSMALVLKRLWNQNVEIAHDGPEALEKTRTFHPEVILLDIGLPGMSGYEVAERLRDIPEFGSKLLIAMTGLGQENDIEQSLQAGFDHHLVKPVDPETIRAFLANPDLATNHSNAGSRLG
jgi:two-component system CheB/CheR fusion protein